MFPLHLHVVNVTSFNCLASCTESSSLLPSRILSSFGFLRHQGSYVTATVKHHITV